MTSALTRPMALTRPAAVIFDCDGVIVDSEPLAFDLLAKDFADHGLTMSRAEMERTFIGGTIPGLWQQARALGATLPDDWVADFYARLYARLEAGTPLVPGILPVLDALDAAGIGYGIGSNGSSRKMQITLGQHGLTGRFRALLSGQEIGAPKPAPDLYLAAARALGADPADCVVVEDSPTGATAARAAGIRCLGYVAHGDPAPLVAAGAQPFTRMADLPGLLGL